MSYHQNQMASTPHQIGPHPGPHGQQNFSGPPHDQQNGGNRHNNQNRQNYQNNQPEMFGVFVGDLASHVHEDDLKQLFSTIGPVVNCKVIRDPFTQRSKKYGFVHFPSEELRQKAIDELHNSSLKGQVINVRTQHYKETDRCILKPGTKPTDVYIGNIPRGLTKSDLQKEVALWGIPEVKEVRIHHRDNESGSFCFLTFPSEVEAKTALNVLNDQINPRFLAGRSLLIQGQGAISNSLLNARFLQNPHVAQTPEEQQIAYSLEMLKTLLGGDGCPLSDNQLALLEKSQRTLYVRNLHPGATEKTLRDRFKLFGALKSVVIVTDRDTQVPVGYGFVEFFNASDCSQAAVLEDSCSVSRPPKEIHAILTALGLTDSSGRLFTQFTTSPMPQQQAYFQDPKTGQLFLGDSAHAAHYISQGYVQVQLQQSTAQPGAQSQNYGQQQQYLPTQGTPGAYAYQQQAQAAQTAHAQAGAYYQQQAGQMPQQQQHQGTAGRAPMPAQGAGQRQHQQRFSPY